MQLRSAIFKACDIRGVVPATTDEDVRHTPDARDRIRAQMLSLLRTVKPDAVVAPHA